MRCRYHIRYILHTEHTLHTFHALHCMNWFHIIPVDTYELYHVSLHCIALACISLHCNTYIYIHIYIHRYCIIYACIHPCIHAYIDRVVRTYRHALRYVHWQIYVMISAIESDCISWVLKTLTLLTYIRSHYNAWHNHYTSTFASEVPIGSNMSLCDLSDSQVWAVGVTRSAPAPSRSPSFWSSCSTDRHRSPCSLKKHGATLPLPHFLNLV